MFELSTLIVAMALVIVSAMMVVFSRHAFYSALWMVANMFLLAVIFLMLRLQFLAILQVIVYAGAIMMFIIYAVMMLNLRYQEGTTRLLRIKGLGLLLVAFLFPAILALLGLGMGINALSTGELSLEAMLQYGEVPLLANAIFSDFLLPFELVSVLLTAGIVGAVALAKRSPSGEED